LAGFTEGLALLFVVLALAGSILFNAYKVIRALVNYFFKDFINRHLLFRKLNHPSKVFLEKNLRYYQRLSHKNRVIFERRVQKFINMKEFIPRGGLSAVTIEMKTLIAAAAIQITFGHPGIYFEHFYRILVYPDNYYSSITRRYHKGEVHTAGIIVLSWKNLLHGYLDHADGRNLGLHEMAHALRIVDAIRSEEYNFMDTDTFNEFIWHARLEMEQIASGGQSFFRDYASANDHEFFAVSVENFFERPLEFNKYHPTLYSLLAELLNQSTLEYACKNVTEDVGSG